MGELTCKGATRQALRHTVTLGMSVRKEWRNHGIGSRLLAEAIAWAHRTGIITRVELYVYDHNQAAIQMYIFGKGTP